jgi:hypothetical protein
MKANRMSRLNVAVVGDKQSGQASPREKPRGGQTGRVPIISFVESAGQTETINAHPRFIIGNTRLGRPKPEKVIADLDRQILEHESSGVLNWMLEGFDKLRADNWQLVLTANQQAAVNNLLLESDGHAVFARECLKPDRAQTLSLSDAYAAYVEFCTQRGWTALTRNKFTPAISDEVARQFGITTRNDIPDAKGRAQRGWKGLACTEKFAQPTNETVSELSASDRSDTSDTLFSVQPEKISVGEKPELVEEFI